MKRCFRIIAPMRRACVVLFWLVLLLYIAFHGDFLQEALELF